MLGSRTSVTSSVPHCHVLPEAEPSLAGSAPWDSLGSLEGPGVAQPAMHYPAVLLLLLPGGVEAFRICAFNAQRLTLVKAAREHVMDTLVRVRSSLKESCAHSPKPPPCLTRGISERRGDNERHGSGDVEHAPSLSSASVSSSVIWVRCGWGGTRCSPRSSLLSVLSVGFSQRATAPLATKVPVPQGPHLPLGVAGAEWGWPSWCPADPGSL